MKKKTKDNSAEILTILTGIIDSICTELGDLDKKRAEILKIDARIKSLREAEKCTQELIDALLNAEVIK